MRRGSVYGTFNRRGKRQSWVPVLYMKVCVVKKVTYNGGKNKRNNCKMDM